MEKRIKYLESRFPKGEARQELEAKYQKQFKKYAFYMGNGIYQWMGLFSTDTRELFLMGILALEGISFKTS